MDGILSALLVIVRTPHIRQYLEQTEPKALEQALEAIEDLEADQQSRNSLVQECLGLDLQPLGDANQVKDGEVADASLDPRDGDAGDAARLGEVGLGEAPLHGSMRQGSRLATRARFSGTRTLGTTSRYLNIHRRGLHDATQKLAAQSPSVAQPLHTTERSASQHAPLRALGVDKTADGLRGPRRCL
jgi:hypothetical protein